MLAVIVVIHIKNKVYRTPRTFIILYSNVYYVYIL